MKLELNSPVPCLNFLTGLNFPILSSRDDDNNTYFIGLLKPFNMLI